MIDERSQARLADMRIYALDALFVGQGLSEADLAADRIRYLALCRALELIGEAATHVAKPVQDRWPSIPWRNIVGMRIVLAHAYGRIEFKYLTDVVADQIPQLIAELDSILGTPST